MTRATPDDIRAAQQLLSTRHWDVPGTPVASYRVEQRIAQNGELYWDCTCPSWCTDDCKHIILVKDILVKEGVVALR